MPRPADRFREQIQATLANAVRAPYYKKTFGSVWKRVERVEDMTRLPLLDKPTAIEVQRKLVVGKAPPGFGVASSGTTRRGVDIPPLNIVHTHEEEEAIRALAPRAPDDAPEEPFPGWTLVVIAVTHGLPAPPGPGELHVPWLHDRNSLYMMETVLSRPQSDGRRVTAMRVSVGALKTFTAWMLERGKPLDTLGVRLIGTNSFRLSPFWRDLIGRAYRAQIFDNYSMSEFATPATECKACGWMHFGWPPLIYEVLDLHSGAQLTKGAGKLVLTSVFPFVQKMPLVRYDTGDVVELGPRCRVTKAQGIRFLGRIRRGLVIRKRGTYVLAPCHVQDVLEASPETARTAHPLVTLGHIASRDIGLPRWEVEYRERPAPTAQLRFEVRFDPHIFFAHGRQLGLQVRREVLAIDAPLRKLVKSGKLRFEVTLHPEGSLTPPPDKHD